jgi:hypothetical protein
MLANVDRALTLNPSFARGWHVSGYLRALAGDDVCIEHLETALRLSPRSRVGTTLFLLGRHIFADDGSRKLYQTAFGDGGGSNKPGSASLPSGMLCPYGSS